MQENSALKCVCLFTEGYPLASPWSSLCSSSGQGTPYSFSLNKTGNRGYPKEDREWGYFPDMTVGTRHRWFQEWLWRRIFLFNYAMTSSDCSPNLLLDVHSVFTSPLACSYSIIIYPLFGNDVKNS